MADNNQNIHDPSIEGTGGLRGLEGVNRSGNARREFTIFDLANNYKETMEEMNRTASPVQEIGFVGINDSMFDEDITSASQLDDLNNTRGELQPWYAQIGAGIAKGSILAGTTFLDGTLGLVVGGVDALVEGDASKLWNNEVSKFLQAINQASEEWLPNYYTNEELNSPWYENILTANFIGDKFLKNIGFSVGAMYSGGVFSSGLAAARIPAIIAKATNSVRTGKAVSTLVGATMSAVNEGRIEALNNSTDWANLETQKLDDIYRENIAARYAPQLRSLEAEYQRALEEYEANRGHLQRDAEGRTVDPAYQQYQNKIAALDARRNAIQNSMATDFNNRTADRVYQNTAAHIQEDAAHMGNVDLLSNIPILTLSNLVQFGRFYSRGFNTARRAGVRETGNILEGTAKFTGKNFNVGTVALRGTGHFLEEGTEEMAQQAASLIAGDYYSTDVSNFYKAQIDPNAEQQTLSAVKSIANGINETINDGSSWEQFFTGGLTGLLGTPSFRSPKSNGKWRSPITLESGIFNDFREHRAEVKRSQEIATYLNNRVQSPEFLNYYRGLIRHTKYQRDMNNAVEENNPFDFKNAEHAQFISDIVMFDNAGRLNELKEVIEELGGDTSDKNLDLIVDGTTSDNNGKKISPFTDKEGNRLDKEEMIKVLHKSRDKMLKTIKNYRAAKENMDAATGGNLSNEQLSEMTWLKLQIDDWQDRAKEMTPLIRKTLTDVTNRLETQLKDRVRKASTLEEQLSNEILAVEIALSRVQGVDRIAQLKELASKSDKELVTILTHPKGQKFVEGIIEDINEFGSDIIGALDKQHVIKLMQDLPKIGKGIETYNNKLKEYLADPAKVAKDQAKAKEEVANKIQQEKSKSLRDKLSTAATVKEFEAALAQEEDRELSKGIIEDLINEGNEVAKNYKDTRQYDYELQRALNQLGETSQVVQDALALWKAQTDRAENLDQISSLDTLAINNEEAFVEDSGGDVNLANTRFQNARYALQRAMEKVNNDVKFKNRFAKQFKGEVKKPEGVKGRPDKAPERETTGDSKTPTVPSDELDENFAPVDDVAVGDIPAGEATQENNNSNREVEDQHDLENSQEGKKMYYRPAVPEFHIEASKEGDFRPWYEVVLEREGFNPHLIYEYLVREGAFKYVNSGRLKVTDKIRFMIDPVWEESVKDEPWHTGPTIFLVTEDGQVVGSLDEGASMDKFEGLKELIQKVRDEYQASRQSKKSTQPSKNNNTPASAKQSVPFNQMESMVVITNNGEGVGYFNDREENTTLPEWAKSLSNRDEYGHHAVSGEKPEGLTFNESDGLWSYNITFKTTRGTGGISIVFRNKPSEETLKVADKIKQKVYDINTHNGSRPNFEKTVNTYALAAVENPNILNDLFQELADASLQDPEVSYDTNREVSIESEEAQSEVSIRQTYKGIQEPSSKKDWVKEAVSEARTALRKKDPSMRIPTWIEQNGHSTFAIPITNGRVGDNWAISFRRTLNESQKRFVEALLNSNTRLTPRVLGQILNIIEENSTATKNKPSTAQDTATEEPAQSTERFVASPSTSVSKIMVGKLHTSPDERNLGDALIITLGADGKPTSFSMSNGSEPIFGIIKNGVLTTNGKLDDRLILKPADMSNEGRLYLLIPNAAGTYSPAAVRVKHLNAQEFNPDDATVASTIIGSEINEAIDEMAGATSQDDINKAYYDKLAKVVFLGKEAPADREVNVKYFNDGRGRGIEISRKKRNPDGTYKIITIDGKQKIEEERVATIMFSTRKNEITFGGAKYDYNAAKDLGMDMSAFEEQQTDPAEVRKQIVSALLSFNFPLQVRASEINKSAYNFRLLEGNILTSNLTEAKIVGNWFTMNPIDGSGKEIKAKNPSPKNPPAPKSLGPSPVGGTESIQGTKVTVNGTSYIIDLKHNKIFNEKTGKISSAATDSQYQLLTDLAWAQDVYGDATESARMTDNKVITPNGRVLDRSTGKYLNDEEAQKIKDKLEGKKKPEEKKPEEKKGSEPSTSGTSSDPIFNTALESKITTPEQNRVNDLNAFTEGGEVGYYELDGIVYKGYLKKIGEVEVTYGSGQKEMVPVYHTKIRDRGFGREGEVGSTSEYIVVFPNGRAIHTGTNDKDDNHAAEIAMEGISKKPEKVLSLSNEKTQIYNPRELEELDAEIREKQYTPSETPEKETTGGAEAAIEAEDDVNKLDDEFEDELDLDDDETIKKLRKADGTRQVWDSEKELAWLRKVLPQLSEQDRVRIRKGLIQVAENGPVAWGMFSDGIVTLSDIAAEGTAYHEAFHVVFNLLMSPQEREALFEEARELFGNKDNLSLEEDMAEGFREYIMSQENRSFGRKILDFFRNLFAKVTNWKYMKPSLYAYYQMINQGKYKKADLGVTSISRLRQEEYTPEMQSIKDKAIADGTFMKAPNGKPTNLNERQWLQVRTKAFKDWFGDWETIAKLKSIENDYEIKENNEIPPHDDSIGYNIFYKGEKIGIVALSNFNNNLTIRGIGLDTKFRGKGIGKNFYKWLSYTAYKNNGKLYSDNIYDSTISIDAQNVWNSLIKEGIAEIDNYSGGYHTILPSTSKVVDENDEPLVVYHTTTNVYTEPINKFEKQKKYMAKNLFYFSNNKKSSQTYFTGTDTIGNKESRDELLQEYKDNNDIFKNAKSLDDVEKILLKEISRISTEVASLEEPKRNGPRILGKVDLNTGEVIKFKNDKEDKIKQLKSNKRYYEDKLSEVTTYLRVERGGFDNIKEMQTYPVFLNIRIPFTFDAKHRSWEEIADNLGLKYDFNIEKLYFKNKDFFEDGLIIENYVDTRDSHSGIESTTFAVNKSNQIKSATSNTGEFSTTNDDIRYRVVDDNGVQWGTLTAEETQALEAKGWTQEQFDRISQIERDRAIECIAL